MKNSIYLILITITIFGYHEINGQDWDTSGNTNVGGEFLGTNNNFPLDFRINGTQNMQIAKSENITVQGETFNHAGFLGISTESAFYNTGAFSLLHLNGGNLGGPYSHGFRSWMKYGMTITANRDMMYVGIKNNNDLDKTEAVLSWSDNDSSNPLYGPDNLLFKFTSSGGQSNAANSTDGLEVARFAPDGNVGIGDFSDNGFGLNQQPTQKLDVDRTVRLRLMPDSIPDVVITGVIADSINGAATGDYILNYTPVDSVNFGDCDWEADGSGIFTGAPFSACNTKNVAIGTNTAANTKFFIYDPGTGASSNPAAMRIRANYNNIDPVTSWGQNTDISGGLNEDMYTRYGSFVTAVGAKSNFGTFSRGSGTKLSVGLAGIAIQSIDHSIGVYGYVDRTACNSSINIGLYGEAEDNICQNLQNYAGYFVGSTLTTNVPISVSDEMFKEDITDLNNAMALINAMHPKIYSFKNEEYAHMNLPDRPQCGLIAQELEEVLPNLVYNSTFPAKFDSAGTVLSEPIAFKGVNYQELIPILIQATKEQNEQIQSQEETIQTLENNVDQLMGQMEELLTAMEICCSNKSNESEISNSGVEKLSYELYQNVPNPFEIYTTISWKMAKEGQAKIIVQDLSGRIVGTLFDGISDEGLHQLEWNTGNLNAGTYFYSLHVNDELLVKRAVKIK